MAGPLLNAKYERFAQLLARGMATVDAYEKAGFKRNTGNAVTLKNKSELTERVNEILDERKERQLQTVEEYLEEEGIDQAYVLRLLLDNAVKAREVGQFTASNNALVQYGKEAFNMFVDKKQVSVENTNVNVNTRSEIPIQALDRFISRLSEEAFILDGEFSTADEGAVLLCPADPPSDGDQ